MREAVARKGARRTVPVAAKPRIGVVGAGWIGRNRMEAVADSGLAEIVAIVEPSVENAREALSTTPDAELLESFDAMLCSGVDAVMIATPNSLHAEQATAALESGLAVFCQKPLARNASEALSVVEAARKADRLLSVDLSYRSISGVDEIRSLVRNGQLGEIFAVNLVFHNAYGPDKSWFYDPEFSGGGCLLDLGVHLVDLAMWVLDFPPVTDVTSRIFAGGTRLNGRGKKRVEDYVSAVIDLEGKATAQLACSWNLNAGQAAAIEATFYGTRGGASIRNVNGSFFDFETHRFNGTERAELTTASRNNTNWQWGGKAAVEWVDRVAKGEGFDESAQQFADVAEIIDRIYAGR